MSAWTALVVILFAAACGTPHYDTDLTIFHATDPHLFEEPGKERPGKDRESVEVRQKKEKLNRDALSDFFRFIAAGSSAGSQRRAVVLTGDFGIDSSWTDQARDSKPNSERHRRADQVKVVGDLFKSSPVRDIYLVLGNNDLEGERAGEQTLATAGQFFRDVGKELDGSGVTLHILLACYQGKSQPAAGCIADVPGTSIRFIGFPSSSFKNTTKEAYEANQETQKDQLETFASLVAAAKARDRKVLVLSHIPELDDPFLLARERFTGEKPDARHGNAERPRWSSWNVSSDLFRRWKELIDSPTVLGILAGHFHDSHREIYYRPYRWSSSSPLRPDPWKLFLAPPLAVKLQETSPIQARGFSMLDLKDNTLSQQFYWYDAANSTFAGDPRSRMPSEHRIGPLARWMWPVSALWVLGGDLKPLDRVTVIAIAAFLAFLTVAILWDVPTKATELSASVSQGPADTPSKAQDKSADKPTTQREPPSPLTSNLGKTAISGLTGLAAISFLDTLWEKPGAAPKAYYLIWFVFLFFVGLPIVAVLRGTGELLRSRIAREHRPPPWEPRRPTESVVTQWLRYRYRRSWSWAMSWRAPLLIFADTSLSVLFGKNVLGSAVLGDEVLALQWSMIRTIDRMRERIAAEVRTALINAGVDDLNENSIRVNVSVLSADETSAYYISWAPGSLVAEFPKYSVAWLSIYTGEARWWKKSYQNHDNDIVVFDNRNNRVAGAGDSPTLKQFFQTRRSQDYEAFIILPVPWRPRAVTNDYWRAGIHISLSKEAYFDKLWPSLFVAPPGSGEPEAFKALYNNAQRLLDSDMQQDNTLRAVLKQSVEAMAEILSGFKPIVYEMHIRPHQIRR